MLLNLVDIGKERVFVRNSSFEINMDDVTLTVPDFRERIVRVGAMDLPNLAPIRAYCCDQEEKFILYNYIPTRSLYDRLYAEGAAKPFKFGISYSHVDNISRVNIKSSNILLTTDSQAHTLDLGLPSSLDQSTT
ncbi:hypothetical protein CTI12_AA316860 [Artemisia annua]|uniref:Protein kinase domain-containing protein n=1 Tax=Artemisia annua TaxID=35608 RepID=A0A2U1N240_ARTAN|nr:hypothetical protein CTI12_AA316860 [Artemisia annua]